MAGDILKQYACGPVRLHAEDDYVRHLLFDHVVTLEDADQRERFEAVARSLRDLLSQRWLLTQKTQDEANAKRVCCLSIEFLLGRSPTISSTLASRRWCTTSFARTCARIAPRRPAP